MIRWLILTPEELLDRLDRQRRAAEGVGGVDLVVAVARGSSTTVSRGIDSRREVPPPIRNSMIVSERLPASLVFAPGSLEPFGRWSVPRTAPCWSRSACCRPSVSAAFAESGTLPRSIWALTRNSTSDSSSQPTTAVARYRSPRFQVRRPRYHRRRPRAVVAVGARPIGRPQTEVLLAAKARFQAARADR